METERTLLDAAKKKNKDAFAKIFDLYASPLYNYALRLCGDPVTADHVVGDVFARLLEQIASGNGPTSNLRSYLYQTAYHRIIDETRYSRRRVSLEVLPTLRPDLHAWLPGFEDGILLDMIQHAIQHDLTDDQRQVVILRFLEEFNLRETAAILGKPVDHVKVIQVRAIAKLRKVLEHKRMPKAVALPRAGQPSTALSA